MSYGGWVSRYRKAQRVSFVNRLRPSTDGLSYICPLCLVSLVGISSMVGCSARQSVFRITDYRDTHEPITYTETFGEAYYSIDGQGNLDLVLRRNTPGEKDHGEPITQIVHIRSFWRSIPGRTVASSSQINSTISYLIMTGRVGAAFEGAGSVFFKENRSQDTLTGSLEEASLSPTKQRSGGMDLFGHARLTGTFRATHDRRRTVRIINEIEQMLGESGP